MNRIGDEESTRKWVLFIEQGVELFGEKFTDARGKETP